MLFEISSIQSFSNILYRSSSSVNTNDMTEASVANITISNESLSKGGESIIVSGKGMSSTVKVDDTIVDKQSESYGIKLTKDDHYFSRWTQPRGVLCILWDQWSV